MNISEFIGFIITMIAFFFLIFKQARDAKRRRDHPEVYDNELEEQQSQIQSLLKSLDLDEDEEVIQEIVKPYQSARPPILAEEERIAEDARKTLSAVVRQQEADLKYTKARKFEDFHAKKGEAPIKYEDFHAKMGEGRTPIKYEDFHARKVVVSNPLAQRQNVLRMLQDPNTIKDAVILREILGPPKWMN
jgi:hypothetical protein